MHGMQHPTCCVCLPGYRHAGAFGVAPRAVALGLAMKTGAMPESAAHVHVPLLQLPRTPHLLLAHDPGDTLITTLAVPAAVV
jgi:hypothetical protein